MVERGTCGFTFVNRTQQRVRGLPTGSSWYVRLWALIHLSVPQKKNNILSIEQKGSSAPQTKLKFTFSKSLSVQKTKTFLWFPKLKWNASNIVHAQNLLFTNQLCSVKEGNDFSFSVHLSLMQFCCWTGLTRKE